MTMTVLSIRKEQHKEGPVGRGDEDIGAPEPSPAPRPLTPLLSPRTPPCFPQKYQEAVPVKLQVERDHLAEAVAWTARALPARPTAPVLAGMRLHAAAEMNLSTYGYE